MWILFYRMTCRESHHSIGKVPHTHDLCRSHSFCSRGFKYFAAPCAVCRDLWDTVQDTSVPQDAIAAFAELEDWIAGFRKNSRNRTLGTDYFYEPSEREAYQEVLTIHANLRAIP